MASINSFVNDDVLNNKYLTNINVDMQDMILTPHTCANLIIEMLKVLLYEKSQIPYPFIWMQNALSKRKPEPNIHSHKVAIMVNKYYNLADSAYKCVEDITTNLRTIMVSGSSQVREVVILFGSTPYTPKEVFTIQFPQLASGHSESNHSGLLHKKIHRVLRKVFLSEEWLQAMLHQVQPTNTFVMVKKIGVLRHDDEYFEHYVNFVVPANVRHTTITLHYDKAHDTCCENLRIYGDLYRSEILKDTLNLIQSRNAHWYQARGVIRGFHDFYIEKVSVSELW